MSLVIWVSLVREHISLVICVSWEGELVSLVILCFPCRVTHITSGMCLTGWTTHITWDLCSFRGLVGEYISLGICVPG